MEVNEMAKQKRVQKQDVSPEASIAKLAAVQASLATDAAKERKSLRSVIDAHREALATWLGTAPTGSDKDLEAEGDEYDRFKEAEFNFVVHACHTEDDVQEKLAYVVKCRELAEAIYADISVDRTSYQTLFLRSLLLPRAETKPDVRKRISDLDMVSVNMWELIQLLDMLNQQIGEIPLWRLTESYADYLKNAMALAPVAKSYAEKIDATIEAINVDLQQAVR